MAMLVLSCTLMPSYITEKNTLLLRDVIFEAANTDVPLRKLCHRQD